MMLVATFASHRPAAVHAMVSLFQKSARENHLQSGDQTVTGINVCFLAAGQSMSTCTASPLADLCPSQSRTSPASSHPHPHATAIDSRNYLFLGAIRAQIQYVKRKNKRLICHNRQDLLPGSACPLRDVSRWVNKEVLLCTFVMSASPMHLDTGEGHC